MLVNMRDAMQHRGPDDSGLFIDAGIALGHRRLSIVDLDHGHQPMASADGALQLVFNGEIYNFRELRERLKQRGYKFSTDCDTEVIISLYKEYGERCVNHLRGMFAFAVWDSNERRLFLARDRLGIKPLYYTMLADRTLLFASEIKGILASQLVPARLAQDSVPDYLANYATSASTTLFESIKRMLPGHTLNWSNGESATHQYWDVNIGHPRSISKVKDAECVRIWQSKFENAVESHLMSDVPVGVLLSGGIDSTAIAAVMRDKMPSGFKSFSVAFSEKGANELEYARMAADEFGTDHHEVLVTADSYFRSIPRLIWHEDEPLAQAASIPLYHVCCKAAEHVKVVLTGEGSDELMAGYGRYWRTQANLRLGRIYESILPRVLRQKARHALATRSQGRAIAKLSRTFLARTTDLESLFIDNFCVFTRNEIRELLSPGFRDSLKSIDPYTYQRSLLSEVATASDLDKMLYIDCKVYLQELLMKQDQMSMAASIESRVPFLDRELVDYTLTLPERMKLRGLTTKWILRQAMDGKIPAPILKRPKMGFPVPLATWFRTSHASLVENLIDGERARSREIFDSETVTRILREHKGGVDHSLKIWSLLNFEIWSRQAIDGDSIADCEKAIAD